jgi:hypothetical protein
MLSTVGGGFGALGLASLLQNSASAATQIPHFAPRAKRAIFLFMSGGPSQVDTFDPKPLLKKLEGQKPPGADIRTASPTAGLMPSTVRFIPSGQSGIPVSEHLQKTARHIDDMAIIRSMHAEVPNHEPSLMLMNCGDGRLPRPSFGAWVTYGLGTENRNLPAFLAMCPGGYPIVATRNWRSAFLPGACQGTYINTKNTDVEKLIENIRNGRLPLDQQRRQLDLTQLLNAKHAKDRLHDPQLESRIESFELAFRMQSEAGEAFDISREPKHIQESYGSGTHGRQLLITRRLLERGVRFIQVWSGGGQPWDNHSALEKNHRKLGLEWDQPIAAFLGDLKQRGMLDSTLVQWGGEFGRTPVAEKPALNGRDHNHYGFTCWLAGGGVKGGQAYGETDEFGFRAVDKPVAVHDLHATMLHLLGMDHTKLTHRYAGRDFRLTDVHGEVVEALIA